MEPTVILLIVVTVAATVLLRSISREAAYRVPKSASGQAMTGLSSSGQQILLHTDPYTHKQWLYYIIIQLPLI